MTIIGTITSKGQTTVPKIVRDRLGLSEGSRIVWELEDGSASITPRRLRAGDLAGMLGNPSGKTMSIEEVDVAVGAALAEDDERISSEWREHRE